MTLSAEASLARIAELLDDQSTSVVIEPAASIQHRTNVTALDKLALPTPITQTDQLLGTGSLVPGTTYKYAVTARNRWGIVNMPAASVGSRVLGAAKDAIRLAFAQVVGADSYEIFLASVANSGSSGANPKWAASITEAERASGVKLTTYGQPVVAGAVAGAIDLAVEGAGLNNNSAPFVGNNAYKPTNVATPIDCTGKSKLHVRVKQTFTPAVAFNIGPSASIIPFFQEPLSPSDWFHGQPQFLNLGGAGGQSFEQEFVLEVDGMAQVVLLVDALSSGSQLNIWTQAV